MVLNILEKILKTFIINSKGLRGIKGGKVSVLHQTKKITTPKDYNKLNLCNLITRANTKIETQRDVLKKTIGKVELKKKV